MSQPLTTSRRPIIVGRPGTRTWTLSETPWYSCSTPAARRCGTRMFGEAYRRYTQGRWDPTQTTKSFHARTVVLWTAKEHFLTLVRLPEINFSVLCDQRSAGTIAILSATPYILLIAVLPGRPTLVNRPHLSST